MSLTHLHSFASPRTNESKSQVKAISQFPGGRRSRTSSRKPPIYVYSSMHMNRNIYIYIWRLLICRWTYSLVVGATRGQQGAPDRSAATFAFGRPGHDRHGLSISAPGGLQNRRGDKRMLYHSCCELEWAQAWSNRTAFLPNRSCAGPFATT